MQRLRIGILASLLLPAVLSACAAEADQLDPLAAESRSGHGPPGTDAPQPIDAKAAFGCDFDVDPLIDPATIPPIIERDRMHMADQDGMITKRLPFGIDPMAGAAWSGGRYLFDEHRDAREYAQWVTEGFVLDGTQFLDRAELLATDCRTWRNIAAYDLTDEPSDHVVMRAERWQVPGNANVKGFIQGQVPAIVQAAQDGGLTGVWVLYEPDEQLVELVYYGGRVAPPPPDQPDFASFGALAGMPSLGGAFDAAGWARVFDRTSFVLTIWFPFELGDQGQPSLWPNSPPLPAPYCTDGVCEPGWGEDATTCAPDCTPSCGDGYCDPDEDVLACPSDCRLR